MCRVVFDVDSPVNQTLWLRPAGYDDPEDAPPGYRLRGEIFNGDLQESIYASVPPASYE